MLIQRGVAADEIVRIVVSGEERSTWNILSFGTRWEVIRPARSYPPVSWFSGILRRNNK